MRTQTTRLIEMMDRGLVVPKAVALMALCYMSEADVADMMRASGIGDQVEEDGEDEDEAALNNFNYVGSRHHY